MDQQPLFLIQLHLQKKQVSHFIFVYDYIAIIAIIAIIII